MTFQEFIAADLRNIIADVPQVFVFQGQEYTGSISGTNRTRKLEVGGFDDMPELSIAICLRQSDGTDTFVNAPVTGNRIRVNGIDYRVDRSEVDALRVGLRLDLRKDTK